MSEPKPSLNIGGNAENCTFIVGDSNQAETSNKQNTNVSHSSNTNSPKETHKTYSVVERRRLRQTLNALPLSLFEDLVYDLAVPAGILPGVEASQPKRCRALLSWAESTEGIGLAQVEELLIPMIAEQARRTQTYLDFVIKGKITNQTISEVEPIIQLLRQITGDDSINISFVDKGSIRIVLTGSSDGLKKLQGLYESGELEGLDIPSVEIVRPVDNDTAGARKARLVEALQLREQFFSLESLLAHVYARARLLSRKLAASRELFRNRALARELSHDIVPVLSLILDSPPLRDRVRDLRVRSIDDLDLDLVRDLANALDRVRASTSIRDLDRSSVVVRVLDLARALAHALVFTLAHALDRVSVLDRASSRAIVSDLIRFSAFDSGGGRDLTDADLRGANLRNLNLVGVDLTGTELTGADVQGTIFGDNKGLAESAKRDLEKRGAIFQDSPGADVLCLVPV